MRREKIDQLQAPVADIAEAFAATEELTDDEIRMFFEAYPQARAEAAALAERLAGADRMTKSALTDAYVAILIEGRKTPEQWAQDEDFLQAHIFCSPRVKAYFAELLENEAARACPVPVRGTAAMIGAKKPVTLSDAGEIACKIL